MKRARLYNVTISTQPESALRGMLFTEFRNAAPPVWPSSPELINLLSLGMPHFAHLPLVADRNVN